MDIKTIIVIASILLITTLRASEIHDAATNGELNHVKQLIESNQQLLNLHDNDGRTPLHWACRGVHFEIIKYLVEMGADINATDANGMIPLHNVAARNHPEAVKFLIENGAHIDEQSIFDSGTPLHYAIQNGFINVVSILLDNGARGDLKNRYENTPLHDAVLAGNRDIFELLVDKLSEKDSALLNIKDFDGNTALHLACIRSDSKSVAYLVTKGADINIRNTLGQTPYNIVKKTGSGDIASFLIQNGANQSPQKFPLLKGPYLGQTPPGKTPKLFAKGIVSTSRGMHANIAFSPDLNEVVWESMDTLYIMKMENNIWSAPEKLVLFKENYSVDAPYFSQDGQRMFFVAGLRDTARLMDNEKIWYIERKNTSWSEPQLFDSLVNAEPIHWQTSMDKNGNVYTSGLNCILFESGTYTTRESLPAIINVVPDSIQYAGEVAPFISPDGDFLIFDRFTPPPPRWSVDFLISFKDDDGNWTKAKDLTSKINGNGTIGRVSPDGKYLFFLSTRPGSAVERSVYWIDAEVIEELKREKQVPTTQDIIKAISFGDLNQVIQIVEEYPNLAKAADDRGYAPLHYAVSKRQIDIAKLLLSKGANVSAQDMDGDTPLHWAAEIGMLDMIELLLLENADINQVNRNGWPPIYWAINRNQPEAVTALIKRGASVDVISNDNQTLIAVAIDRGNPEIVNALISKGASLNFTYADGNSLLYRSILRGNFEVAHVLLENGINPNTQNYLGLSPLHIAAVSGNAQTVKQLLAHNADASAKSIDGGTPLDFAIAAGHKDVVNLLNASNIPNHDWAFPLISGKYMGLQASGFQTEVFNPGIVMFVNVPHGGLSSAVNGTELYWVRNCPSFQKIWYSKEENGKWISPRLAPFNSTINGVGDEDPFVSPDGKKLFFTSNRTLEDDNIAGDVQRVWYSNRDGENWTKPVPLPTIGLDEKWEKGGASVSKSGTVYFHIDYRNQEGQLVADIYRVTNNNGIYSEPQKLEGLINSPYIEAKPYISPNEDYLIFSSHRPGGGIMISFSSPDGNWSEPKCINEYLGNHIHSVQGFTSDGKYLFLNGIENNLNNYYWIDAKFIEDLRP